MEKLSLGIDFGTDSARAVLVGIESGAVVYSCQKQYTRWSKELYCSPRKSEFRQHPLDYIETLEWLLKDISANCSDKSFIVSIGVDATCSTPCLVDDTCTPLSLRSEFADNPCAMFVLWKDKSGVAEAELLKKQLSAGTKPYLKHCGGTYSAEYTWGKILHQLNECHALRKFAAGYIEEMDYICGLLTGAMSLDMKACIAPATIKGLWSVEWGGFPVEEFKEIDLDLARIASNSKYKYLSPGTKAGTLCDKYVEMLGCSTDVIVSVSAVDSHSCMIGSGAGENTLAMTIGTSSCYWVNHKADSHFNISPDGLVGDADSIIVQGLQSTGVGISAFGDIFAWFKNILAWNRDSASIDGLITALSEEASRLPFDENSVLATDHFNGRRSPSLNDSIKAGLCGLSLSTSTPEIFRALVEATAFATKMAIDHLKSSGVRIDSYKAVGGVTRKSSYVMQVLSDVLQRDVTICDYDDSGARGAAVYGAVAAGVFDTVGQAQGHMAEGRELTYSPRTELSDYYNVRYLRYKLLVEFNENI